MNTPRYEFRGPFRRHWGTPPDHRDERAFRAWLWTNLAADKRAEGRTLPGWLARNLTELRRDPR